MERAAPFDAFLQNFNPGIFESNTAFNERMTWESMFHRIPAGFSTTGFSGTDAGNLNNTGADFGNGEYAATGRITFLPLWENGGRDYIHLGANYQWRAAKFNATDQADEVEFRVRPEIFTGNGLVGDNNRFLDTGLIVCDDIQTFGGESAMVLGPFSVQAEGWIVQVEDASIGPNVSLPKHTSRALGNPEFYGAYIQASYFLTGEYRPYDRRFGRFDRVIPNSNFFCVRNGDGPLCKGWGAWEVAARYSLVDFNDTTRIVGTGGMLNETTFGLNWYLNPNMRVEGNYVRVNRDVAEPSVKGDVDEFGVRFHLDF